MKTTDPFDLQLQGSFLSSFDKLIYSASPATAQIYQRLQLPAPFSSSIISQLSMAAPVTIASAVGWGISIAGWLIAPIVARLLSRCFSYLGSCSSDKLKKLEHRFLELKHVFQAAEADPRKASLTLEQWKELKSAFYKAEDILDAVDYHRLESMVSETDSKPVWSKLLYFSTKQVVGIMGHFKIFIVYRRKLKATLGMIQNHEGYKLLSLLSMPASYDNANNTTSNTVRPPPGTTSAHPVVFGRDEDAEMITKMLHGTPVDDYDDEPRSSTTKCYSVIGIHGIPGSGKTTLAQKVYQKEWTDYYFDLVMWIHVSQNFSVHTVFTEMLEIASGRKRDRRSSLDLLQRELEEELSGKRFFLVLDDVWHDKGVSELELDLVLSPLNAGKRGSKVLVTTRNADAAKALGAQKLIAIPDLDKEKFFSMFMHYALDGATISDKVLLGEHERIERKIAEKLGRSPLAARTVAGQLRRRVEDIVYWKSTLNRDFFDDTMGALWWSYQQLDEHVRQCFTYCSMFPRRYALERDKLVHLWMAQGFLETNNGTKDMEDVGHDYFHVLLSTSFIQLKETFVTKYSRTEYFTIHDLMHDLAKRVTGSDCFRAEKGMTGQIPLGVHHLFFHSNSYSVIMEQLFSLKGLRTLFMPCTDEGINEKDFERMIMSLKKLRVVHVRLKKLGAIPTCIAGLKHLRYLHVVGSLITLPPTFARLYHLQYFSHTTCLFDIPNVGKLTSLRNELNFKVRKERGYEIQQLEHLDNLRGALRIEGLQNVKSKVEARQAKLVNKINLSHLGLSWENQYGFIFRNHRVAPHPQEVLEALCPPSQITSLSIQNYWGSTYPNWLSGEQVTLKNLEFLRFSGCGGWDAAPKVSKGLVNLRCLFIENCMWQSLPENMEQLTSLEELTIYRSRIMSLSRLPQSLKKLYLSDWHGFDAPSGFSISLANLCELEISICSWDSLPENMEQLVSLEKLIVNNCQNILTLSRLPESLKKLKLSSSNETDAPLMIGKFMINLSELEITHCSWNSLPMNMQHLVSLKTLTVSYCENILTLPRLPQSLKKLVLIGWYYAAPKIRGSIYLRTLKISNCGWDSLPENMGYLTSLEELIVKSCKYILSLPRLPPSIHKLKLKDCDHFLTESCQMYGHPNWEKIVHIPEKIIK
ncbi:hypothetical protein ACP4OV_002386 [Aristida adscensionis]